MSDSIDFNDFGSANLDRQVRAAKKQAHPKKKKQESVEAGIQKAILEYLEYRPDVKADRVNSGKIQTKWGTWIQLAKDGTSDIIGCYNGRFLAIEVKKPKPNKTYPTKEQRDFIQEINDLGGLAFVARSVEDVIEMMSGNTIDSAQAENLITVLNLALVNQDNVQ